MKKPNLDEIKAYVDKHFVFQPEIPMSLTMPEEYYLIDNVPVSKEQFESKDFAEMIIYSRSTTHVTKMTFEQIFEKFGNQLSEKEIKNLKNLSENKNNIVVLSK